jgi:glutaminase
MQVPSQSQPARAPAASPILAFLQRLHARHAGLDGGQVASYIPELAKACPAHFAIVLATVDGQVYEVGDARVAFTLQSISKALVYGMALEDQVADRLARAIGVEPSGDAFNSISLEAGTGRPRNPMINAGAIATAALVRGRDGGHPWQRLLGTLSDCAGRELDVDEAVFELERSTGHRNRAIGHMLRNYDILQSDPEPALDLYFRQCSVRVHCRDLALMAATLANGGVQPQSGRRVLAAEVIGPMLSVMTTCGMYDFSGEWAWRVGRPAKSGVGGGILAVLLGQLGIGLFSPPLGERGNSVRGVRVCEDLSRELGLHFLQPPRPLTAGVRARYSLAELRSKRRRTAAEEAVLKQHGARVQVFELQGDLHFASLEPVLRAVVDAGSGLDMAVLDFQRVQHADAAALRLLEGLVGTCARRGQQLVLTRVRRGGLLAGLGHKLDPRAAPALIFQPQLDLGLEWAERQILQRHGPEPMAGAGAEAQGLAAQPLYAGLDGAELALLESRVQRLSFEQGSPLLRRGDPADGLYFLLQGEVSVRVDLPQGGQQRLATLSAGMSFGELALVQGSRRTADVRADTGVVCARLGTEDFAALGREHPALMVRLLHNMVCSLGDTARRLTSEVAALAA